MTGGTPMTKRKPPYIPHNSGLLPPNSSQINGYQPIILWYMKYQSHINHYFVQETSNIHQAENSTFLAGWPCWACYIQVYQQPQTLRDIMIIISFKLGLTAPIPCIFWGYLRYSICLRMGTGHKNIHSSQHIIHIRTSVPADRDVRAS